MVKLLSVHRQLGWPAVGQDIALPAARFHCRKVLLAAVLLELMAIISLTLNCFERKLWHFHRRGL